jgi:chromosome partitioning protein
MHIYCLCNIKGGVTKSTSTINIGYGLARRGYRVLILDMDPQCNTTYVLTSRLDENTEGTLYEVLIPKQPTKTLLEVVEPTQEENLFLAPGSIWLSSADIELAGRTNREKVLSKALRGITDFDYVLIDTQPSLGLLTVNSIIASDGLLVPITLATFGLIGIRLLIMSVQELRENMELELPIIGAIASLSDNTNESKELLKQAQSYFTNGELFNTIIPRNIKVEESNGACKPLFDYAPNSTGAKAYMALVDELIARTQEGVNG